MNLTIPTVGGEPGPLYASDIDGDLTLIDLHDHTLGKGVQITPAGLNINDDLTLNGNSLTNVLTVVFNASVSASTTPMSLSVAPGGESPQQQDLWFTPDTGVPIQITKNGQVNVVASSIEGETYAAGTFFWTQAQDALPTTPANFDIGSIVLRPNTAGTSFGVQLVPPSAIASQYSINLPLLPSSQKIVTLDQFGNMTAPYTVDGSTIVVDTNVIKVPAGGITDTQIAMATITGDRLVAHTITSRELAAGLNGTWNTNVSTFSQPPFNVRIATVVNGTFTTAFDNASTVDGTTLATNDLILIKNQDDSTQNGVYVVQASGAPVRSTSYDTFGELNNAAVHVTAGTANAGTNWCQIDRLTSLSDNQLWTRGSWSQFTVPDDVTLLIIEACGSGGSGGSGDLNAPSGASGGSGATPQDINQEVTPGEVLDIFVAEGPAGGSGVSPGHDGSDGFPTVINGNDFQLIFPGGAAGLCPAIHGTPVAAVSTYAVSPAIYGTLSAGPSGAGSTATQTTAGFDAARTMFVSTPAKGGTASSGGANRGRPGSGGGSGFGAGGAGGNGMTVGSGNGNNGADGVNYGSGGGGGSGSLSTTHGGDGGKGANGVVKLYWLGNAS